MKKPNWQRLKDRVGKRYQGKTAFVKLHKDGDRVVGVFVDEPIDWPVHWSDDSKRYERCPGEDACKRCQTKKSASIRAAINFAVHDDHGWKMMVLELPGTFFQKAIPMQEQHGDEWAFEIRRYGDAGDRDTEYDMVPKRKLTPEDVQSIEALTSFDLEQLCSGRA